MVSSAARVGSINVLLSTQLGPGVAGLNAFASAVDRTGATVSQRVAGMDRSIHGLNRSLGTINARGLTGVTVGALRASTALDQLRGLALAAGVAVGGIVPAAIASGMIRTADGAHRLSNQLRTVTTDSTDLKNTQDALFQVAQRTRSAFDSTVTIYARTARATEHLGLSQQKLLRITETVQKAFAVGGASAAEAQGAAIQLSQGIASNRFSGEEFRSVAENAPVLLRGMAESIGVNIGKLREMAHAGELTADVVTKAILEASQRIDEDFAKTTSTIEQAWVRVGNAATKYAMDSENAAAGSAAIVGGLNLVSDNMGGLIEVAAALGAALAATFAARRLQAVSGWASGLKAARIEALAAAQANQALAQAQMQAARSDFLQKRLAFNAALNQGTLSAKQLERQKKALAAASANYRNVTQASTAATAQLAMAQRAASASGVTMAAAGRAVSAAWAFIGGPFGAALLALGGIMYLQSQRAAEAGERSERYADAIKKAGENSGGASPGIQQVAKDLFSVGAGATAAERAVSLASAKTRELGALNQMFYDLEQAGIRGGFGFRHMYAELEALYQQFRAGTISAEEFATASDRIASARPDLAPFIADMQRSAKEADAARGEVSAVADEIDKLDGKQATVTITIGTRRVELTDGGVATKGDRPGASPMDKAAEDMRQNMLMLGRSGWDDLFDFPKPKKSGGGGRSRKSADDRFDNSVQAIRDRIAAMQEEQAALTLSYREQERRRVALELEQEALKQVREEARRKGDTDWQNAQLAPEQIEQINQVAEAYAKQADELRQLSEWLGIAKDVTGGFFSDFLGEVRDGANVWEALGNAALNALDKIASKLLEMATDQLINSLFSNILGALTGGVGILPSTAPIPTPRPFKVGGPVEAASGGRIAGPGTGTSDSILAALSNGEFVVNAEATSKYLPILQAMNDNLFPTFAAGGLVDSVVATASGLKGATDAGASVIQVQLSKDLEARILDQAANQSIQITRTGLQAFTLEAGREMVKDVINDPRKVG
jgi:tape measure domain-containing protein